MEEGLGCSGEQLESEQLQVLHQRLSAVCSGGEPCLEGTAWLIGFISAQWFP